MRIVTDSHDAEEVLVRIDLKNPPFPLTLFTNYAESHCDCCNPPATSKSLTLCVLADVLERNSGSSSQLPFHFSTSLPKMVDEFIEWVGSCVRAVFIHEYQECFHVDDERFEDPHPYVNENITDYVMEAPSVAVRH